VLCDFCTDLAAIHVDREIAVAADPDGGLRVLVRQPAEPPRRANRRVRGRNLDALALGEELLAGFPYGLERVDQPQDCAIALDQRPVCRTGDLVQGGERRIGLGQPPL
jgi:hypothetical protein